MLSFCLLHLFAQNGDTFLNVYHGGLPDSDRIFYIAPDGDDAHPGTEAEPWATLEFAAGKAEAGDVFVMRGGVYAHDATIRINRHGSAERPVTLVAFPGEVPILDFSEQPKASGNIGVRLNGWYWHVIGITIRYAGHNGIRMDGSHNILEQITAYGNHDTGIHMAGNASHNLIKNCDSFHNFNTTGRVGNNADGFGAKFDILPGNRFYGCRAWENSDDGFDLWRAANPIVVENCWSFNNGDPSVFGNPANFEGAGNGFKLGGDYVAGDHVVIRCMAFDNLGVSRQAKGFDHNNNTGALTLIHNTAYNNGRNYYFPRDPSRGQSAFINNLSAVSSLLAGLPPNAVTAGNSWQHTTPVAPEMFRCVDTGPARGPRRPDGSLPEIDLLKPEPGSFLIDGGVKIGEPFRGSAPDIGAREHPAGDWVEPRVHRGSGSLIRDLVLYDMDDAESWSISDDFQAGKKAYGDGDPILSSIPGMLRIDEWIRPSLETRTKNYLFTTAEFTVDAPARIYIAYADAIRTSNRPDWLSDYRETGMKLSVAGPDDTEIFFTLFDREAGAGEIITLGRNTRDGAADALMYLVLAGDTDSAVAENTRPAPSGFVLLQNYPNPFNPVTTIVYHLPRGTHAAVSLFDVTGREVASLADGYHDAGSYRIVWNARSYPAGIYTCRLITDEMTAVRKLVLLR